MKSNTRLIFSVLLGFAAAAPAFADGGMRAEITDAATQKECSACHTAYAPIFMPQRSWTAIMGDLANHFGEDASLPADAQAGILAYLVANAADTGAGNKRMLRGVKDGDTPMRITEMAWWKRSHEEVSSKRFKSDKVKTASNCIACHKTADQGFYSEH